MSKYQQRRNRLIELIEDNSIFVIHSGILINKSADSCYPFCVNKSFYYLTGLDEENLILVLFKQDGNYQEKIYINKFDEVKAKWVSRPYSEKEVIDISGITSIAFNDQFENEIHKYFLHSKCYLDFNPYSKEDKNAFGNHFANYAKGIYPGVEIVDGHDLLTKLRRVKDESEIVEIKKAIEVTNQGIINILKNTKPGMHEYDVEGFFLSSLTHNQRHFEAFPTIVGSGANATILHYVKNNAKLQAGDLVLIDLGAQHEKYHADISRTFPVSGRFTEKQKELYNIVLAGQEYIMKTIKPGLTTKQLTSMLVAFYEVELQKINLISTPQEVSEYFYHGVSHQLGLDTHDVEIIDTKLEAGNVITVEPGLYIASLGIGIRIEDDVLVTEDGCINLSADIPKTIEEIEEIMNS